MYGDMRRGFRRELDDIRDGGALEGRARRSQGPQGARVTVGGREVLNFCANNYLGLASDPR